MTQRLTDSVSRYICVCLLGRQAEVSRQPRGTPTFHIRHLCFHPAVSEISWRARNASDRQLGKQPTPEHSKTTPCINGFVPVCETTRARLLRGLSSQLMRTGTFHRPRPSLYHFALAMAPARYLIDGSRSPTENTQASKQATNPCYIPLN